MSEPFDLQRLHIAKPCPVSWDTMSGDARVRFCGKCRLNVYDTRELTAADVRALVMKTEGKACGRLYRRADGTVLTRDCPIGVRKARIKVAAALTAVVALFIAFIGSVRAHSRDAELFVDDAPSAGAGPFWIKVKVRAAAMEDEARTLPVVGPLIELIDPQPIMMQGMMMVMPPPSTGTTGANDR